MSGPPTTVLAIPEPLDEDDDDIRWALQTAAVQWKRGAREDAIAWLRRGADAAVDGGAWARASQLNVHASQLERAISGAPESEPPAPPSAPKFPPRAPTPASHSVPQSVRSGLPSAPVSERAFTSTPAAPYSRWPTGFPPSAVASSTPSGRAIAPPPPLPPSAKVPKAPIPPRPKSVSSRDQSRNPPDILVGMEELDMSDAELIGYQEDITVRARTSTNAIQVANSSLPAPTPGTFNSLPSYELDEEDPMDGTTALPPPSAYPAYVPDSMDDQALPAFPLEDFLPAGLPTQPPVGQPAIRSSPLPQISLARGQSQDSTAPSGPPQPALGAQKFSRPISHAEPRESNRPSLATARTGPPAASVPIVSDRPPAASWRPPSLRPAPPSEPPPPSLDMMGESPFLETSESLLPTISMDELEEVSAGTSFAPEEPSTSVIPQTPAVPSSTAPASRPPLGERTPKSSPPYSAPPVHLDRDTPIPSSASLLKGISIRGISLADVRGLCDLPEDSHRLLRQRARVEKMGTGEDLSFFSVVLVLEGWVKLMPAIADVTCATAAAGEVVFTQGTLEDGVALRVVAGQNGTTLATWDRETFDEITQSCPWVADELRLIADSFQALAGTALGMLGERLDDALREVVTSRCQVLTLLPNEVLVVQGKLVPGMHIVGAGLIELLDTTGAVVSTVAPGDFLLTDQVLAGGVSPHTVRAAASGALVLFAPRMVAHELLVSVPPLLEILAG